MSGQNRGLWQHFTPPGPKAAGWLISHADIALIIGPYGSAKTTTAGSKCMGETSRQHPSKFDGVRRAKITAVRPNYRRMEDTLVASFRGFFGKEGTWTGTKEGPQEIHMRWHVGGDAHEMLIELRAIGDQSIDSFVRGYQPTAWYFNEFDEMPPQMLSKAASRAGRYALDEKDEDIPPAKYCKVFGDCNMPDLDNWVHDLVLNNPQPGTEVYIQPSGLSPEAENLDVLRRISPTYYEDMRDRFIAEGDYASVERFIKNKAGYTSHGKPVFPMFQTHLHVADATLTPIKTRKLWLGVDQGGQAACVIGQILQDGSLRIYHEVTLDAGEFYGGAMFGEKVAGVLMSDRFRYWANPQALEIRIDPAAKQRTSATKENDERRWAFDFIDGLEAELRCSNIDFSYGLTNNLTTRLDACKRLMQFRTHGGEEGFKIDPSCRRLARGGSGGYRYAPVQGAPGRYKPVPQKPDPHTDIWDAVQYIALEAVPAAATQQAKADKAGSGANVLAGAPPEPSMPPAVEVQF